MIIFALLMTLVLVGSDYITSLQKAHIAKVHAEEQRLKEQKAMRQGADVLGEMLQGSDKAVREFRWPDAPKRKQDGKTNTEGEKQ